MARKPKAQPRATGPQPSPAVTQWLWPRQLRALQRPWRSLTEANVPGLPFDQIEDVRRNETELRRNNGGDGSGGEFSLGKGIEAPWTARRAAAQRRYTTPEDPGGRYHGTTPPPGTFHRRPNRPGQGSAQLHRFLRQYG
jgi:hypothetical protein